MNKNTFAALCLVLSGVLTLPSPATYAGVGVGGECDINYAHKVCSSGLQCSNNTCQYASDKIGDDLQRCKDKLIQNGMSSSGRAAMNDNFCYDDASCPEIFSKLKALSQSTGMAGGSASSSGKNMSYEEFLKDRELNGARYAAEAQEKDATIIRAAAQACSQCTSGGKPRCFYPAREVLY